MVFFVCSHFVIVPFVELFLFGFVFQWLPTCVSVIDGSTNGSDANICFYYFELFLYLLWSCFLYLEWFLCQILSGLLFQLKCCFYQCVLFFEVLGMVGYFLSLFICLCCDFPLNFGFFWCCFPWEVDICCWSSCVYLILHYFR